MKFVISIALATFNISIQSVNFFDYLPKLTSLEILQAHIHASEEQ